MQRAVETAAINLYVARAAANGTLYEAADVSAIETAIEDVAGKIVTRNGVKTPIAPGIEQSRFTGVLDNLSERDVLSMGGAVDRGGRAVSATDLSRYAVLKPLAPGSPLYVVGMRDATSRDGFSPLFTAGVADGGGAPLVFDMARLTGGRGNPDIETGPLSRAARLRERPSERAREPRPYQIDGGRP